VTYFPLDRDILTSSMWAQGTPEQVKVWLYLLLAADPRSGIVEDTDPAIAMRCALPLDATIAALEWLASPDPHSRTKDHEGRRIERLPEGGLRILNYIPHRDKDYSTPRVRRWRELRKAETAGNTVSPVTETVGNDGHGHGHGHEPKERITDCAPASPRAVSISPPKRSPSWSKEAADDWIARFGGTARGERIGKALKPLVALHGWSEVRSAWRSYLGQVEAKYASPQRFAETYGHWSPATASKDTTPNVHGEEWKAAVVANRTRLGLKAQVKP
jgi:hypothetical protein